MCNKFIQYISENIAKNINCEESIYIYTYIYGEDCIVYIFSLSNKYIHSKHAAR